MATLLLGFVALASMNSSAAMAGDVIFERVANVAGQDGFGQTIVLETDTEFTLTLTDFAFPDELDSVGVSLVRAGEELASIVWQSEPDWTSHSWGYGAGRFRPVYGQGGLDDDHSWGEGFRQESVIGNLEAGTYFISMYADFDDDWYYQQGMQYGLYSVEMIATPIPPAFLLMLSGLGLIGVLKRKARKSGLSTEALA